MAMNHRKPGTGHTGRAGAPVFLPRASASWSAQDIQCLRHLAEQGLTVEMLAARLRRTPSAIRNKAAMHGISVRAGRPAQR